MKTKRILVLTALGCMLIGAGVFAIKSNDSLPISVDAAAPAGYYNNADTSSRSNLYRSLNTIVNTD